jgi:hypothetical protein
MRHETGLQLFVRGLIAGSDCRRAGDLYLLADGRSAEADVVTSLIDEGALSGDAMHVRSNAETRAWLKRSLLDADAFAAQHRIIRTLPTGQALNMAESPLARLAQGPAAFLQRHHVEAGERVRRLVEWAQLQPRLTMTYSGSRIAGGPQHKNDISDLAVDARRRLAEIHEQLPADCVSVVLDVCGFLKGLQEVEKDRGWPRRSAKLVLRIGLEQLAQHFGIAAVATGRSRVRSRQWMSEGSRPVHFG